MARGEEQRSGRSGGSGTPRMEESHAGYCSVDLEFYTSHCGRPGVPEPVPGSQQLTKPPATARGAFSAVATHPGGAHNTNITSISSTGTWTGSLYDAANDASLSTSNSTSTPATWMPLKQRFISIEPSA
ncbi:hypothetical protein V5799_009817 [Amblyomma americanum]|uniref:Uncharacterized protein n=1 Tax=Amblyomma americanum TaxID=6943 RepID=A0AAQ4F9F1_AMBAM